MIRFPAILHRVLLGLLLLGLCGCGDKGRLEDYLPPDDTDAPPLGMPARDPLMGDLDGDVRSPTDLDHSVARGKLQELADHVSRWLEEHGALPKSLDVLTPGGDMEAGSAIIPPGRWRVPVDPWGTAYELSALAEGGFVVRSYGPDMTHGTVDDLIHSVPGALADDR